MSGRGLGFTGGTADKLEAIPGYKTEIGEEEFIDNVKEIGISLITQTKSIAPADKKIYALRNAINCIASIPLIASSIMSKKIASGANKIVLDVTIGRGAFMKNEEQAKELSETMINIGKLANKETVCVLTNMEQPLGTSVGNTLEVIEAVKCLNGEMPKDIKEVVLALGSYMIKLSGKCTNIEEARQAIIETIDSGKAFEKFVELVGRQGGDSSYIYDTNKFEKAKYIVPIEAKKEGYIKEINAEKVGKISCKLGSGMIKKEDKIDNSVGIILNKKVGAFVNKNETIGFIHANDNEKAKRAIIEIQQAIKISDSKVEEPVYVIEVIS